MHDTLLFQHFSSMQTGIADAYHETLGSLLGKYNFSKHHVSTDVYHYTIGLGFKHFSSVQTGIAYVHHETLRFLLGKYKFSMHHIFTDVYHCTIGSWSSTTPACR